MGNAIQLEANETATSSGSQTQAAVADRVYKVLPPAGGASQEDLYGFRSVMMEPAPVAQDPESAANEAKSKRTAALLPILFIIVLGSACRPRGPQADEIESPSTLCRPGNPPLRFGRPWSQAYRALGLQAPATSFTSIRSIRSRPPAFKPLRSIRHTRFRSSSAFWIQQALSPARRKWCFPLPGRPGFFRRSSSDASAGFAADADYHRRHGAEYCRSGRANRRDHHYRQSPVFLKQYQSLAAWQFFTNFPTLDEQDEWLRHRKSADAANGQEIGIPAGEASDSPRAHSTCPPRSTMMT